MYSGQETRTYLQSSITTFEPIMHFKSFLILDVPTILVILCKKGPTFFVGVEGGLKNEDGVKQMRVGQNWEGRGI